MVKGIQLDRRKMREKGRSQSPNPLPFLGSGGKREEEKTNTSNIVSYRHSEIDALGANAEQVIQTLQLPLPHLSLAAAVLVRHEHGLH
jgi:hypothetical protein